MKILYISSEFPVLSGAGGIGTYTFEAARAMQKRGHTVHVIAVSKNKTNSRTICQGIIVDQVASAPFSLPAGRFFYPLRRFCYRFFMNTLVRYSWSVAAKNQYDNLTLSGVSFDIIEYPECGGEGFSFRGVSAYRVCRLHTPWQIVRKYDRIREPVLDRIAQNYLERQSARHASAVTSPSRFMADTIRSLWKTRQITVIPNPIEITEYRNSNKSGINREDWIYCGRVEYRKGVHVLIDAYAHLCKKTKPPMLKIIGNPYGKLPDGASYEEYILCKIAEHGIADRVEWIKGATPAEIKIFLLHATIAIFPSLFENFPYACLEAMASGCCVVASHCGGYPEMITSGETGILFDTGNSDALCTALERVLNEPYLATRIGGLARETVGRFDVSTLAPLMEQFYEARNPEKTSVTEE